MFPVENLSNKHISKLISLKRKHEDDYDKKYKILKLMEDCKYLTKPSMFDEVSRKSAVLTFNNELTTVLNNSLGVYNEIETNMKYGISVVSKMEQFYVPNTQETLFHSLNIFKHIYEDIFRKDDSLLMEGIFDDTNKLFCVNKYFLKWNFIQQFEITQFHAIFKDSAGNIVYLNLNKSDLMNSSNSSSQLTDSLNNFSEGNDCFTSIALVFNLTYKVLINAITSTLRANYLSEAVNFIELVMKAVFSNINIVIDVRVIPGIMSCSKHYAMNLTYGIKSFINTECNAIISNLSICIQHGNVNIYSAGVETKVYTLSFDTFEDHTKDCIEKVLFINEGNILKLYSQNKLISNLLDNVISNTLSCINESLFCVAYDSKFELRGASYIDSENTITKTQSEQNIHVNMLEENKWDKHRDLGELILYAKYSKHNRCNSRIGNVQSNKELTYFDISNRNSERRIDFVHIIDKMNLDLEEINTNIFSRKLVSSYESFSQVKINLIMEQLEGRNEMSSNIVFKSNDEVMIGCSSDNSIANTHCFNNNAFSYKYLNQDNIISDRYKLANKRILKSLETFETLFCASMYKAQEKITFLEDKLSPLFENCGEELGNLNYPSKAKLPTESVAKIQSFEKLGPQNDEMDGSVLFLTKLNLKAVLISQRVTEQSKLENRQMSIKSGQINYGILENHYYALPQMCNNSETDIGRCDDTLKHIATSNAIHSENNFLFSIDFKNILRNQQKSLKSERKFSKKDRGRIIQDESVRAIAKGSVIEVSSVAGWNIDCNDRKDAASQTETLVNTLENYEKYSDLATCIRNWSSIGLQKSITKQKHTPYLENNDQSDASYSSEDNYNVKDAETKVHLKEIKLFSADTSFTSDQMLQEMFIDQEVPSKGCLIQEMDISEREPDMYYGVEEKMKKCDLEWEREKSKVRMGLSRKQRVRPLHPYLRN